MNCCKQFANVGTTLAVVLFEKIAGINLIEKFFAKSDKAGSRIIFWRPSVKVACDAESASGQTVLSVDSTAPAGSNIVAGDVVVINTRSGSTYRTVASVSSGVSITLTTNLAHTVAVGDEVFVARASRDKTEIDLGAAEVQLDNPFATQWGMPGIVIVDGTAGCHVCGLRKQIS